MKSRSRSLAASVALVCSFRGAPASASPEAPPPASSSGPSARLDEAVTLKLEDASVRGTLEQLAALAGVTPVLAKSVVGTLRLDLEAVPLREALSKIEKAAGLSIRVAEGRLLAGKPGEDGRRAPADDAALDRALLADPSLPRRPAKARPAEGASAVEVRPQGGVPVVVPLSGAAQPVRLPGCGAGGKAGAAFELAPLAPDAFDGRRRVVLIGAGPAARPLSRVVLPRRAGDAEDGGTLRLPGCETAFDLVEVPSEESGRAAAPKPALGSSSAPRTRVFLELREIPATGDATGEETLLAGPSVEAQGVSAWSTLTMSSAPSAPGPIRSFVQLAGSFLRVEGDAVLLAVAATVIREIDPPDGSPRVALLRARSAESLWLRRGRTERLVLSSTYGDGASALVLDVTISGP